MRAGEPIQGRSRRAKPAQINGWFLTSKFAVVSRDTRRHLDWLLDHLAGREDALKLLQSEGCRMDICCFWASASGHGGPTLSPHQLKRLAALDLEIWFDVYLSSEEATA
jgi:hypothetical protein